MLVPAVESESSKVSTLAVQAQSARARAARVRTARANCSERASRPETLGVHGADRVVQTDARPAHENRSFHEVSAPIATGCGHHLGGNSSQATRVASYFIACGLLFWRSRAVSACFWSVGFRFCSIVLRSSFWIEPIELSSFASTFS